MGFNQMVKGIHLNQDFKLPLDKEYYRALGGSYWKKAYNKRGYMSLQRAVLKDDLSSDLAIGNDEQFRSEIYSGLPGYLALCKKFLNPAIYNNKRLDLPTKLKEIMMKSKSQFSVSALYENTSEYVVRRKARTEGYPPEPETIAMAKNHFAMYEKGFVRFTKLSEEMQERLIISGLIGKTNIGYDLYTKTSKRTFKRQLISYLKRHSIMSVKPDDWLTGYLVLTIFQKCNQKKHNPPFVLFYRTHTVPKVRSVFGAGLLSKLAAAFLRSLKRCLDDNSFQLLLSGKEEAIRAFERDQAPEDTSDKPYIPKIGKWPWLAWLEWGTQFSIISETIRDKDPSKGEIVGEDFSGYDQTLDARDYEFKLDIKTQLHELVVWLHTQMDDAEVYTGPWRLDEIEFKSGMPNTSDDGSLKHYDLTMKVSKDLGIKLLNGIYLSDDNLCHFDDFVHLKDYENAFKTYGFEISGAKTSLLSRDSHVEFLKNLIGYIITDDRVDVMGNPLSKYYNLAHVEREAEERGVYYVTGSIAVDQVVSKLASNGPTATPLIEYILRCVQGTRLGSQSIRAINSIKNGILQSSAYREDLSIGFKPEETFKNVNVPSILTAVGL